MKKIRMLFLAGCCMLVGGGNLASAQTDVTATYIPNAGFDVTPFNLNGSNLGTYGSSSGQTNSTFTPTNWNLKSYDSNCLGATAEYGSSYTLNGAAVPSTDKDGNTTGGSLFISVGWGGTVEYTTDEVTLAEGTYKVSYVGYNANVSKTGFKSRVGFIATDGTEYISTKNSFTSGLWVEDEVQFTVAGNTKGKFVVGGTTVGAATGSTGSGNYAKLFIDGLTLTYTAEIAEEPVLSKRADFGGASIANSDLIIPGTGNYTLEVQGTAGTPITIAADNISYTPSATTEVRFVKYDGKVYVYEDGIYKGTTYSSKANFTYTNLNTESLASSNESNLLGNPSFETLGSSVGTNIYNIGTPWTSNVTMKDGGIRVGTSGSTHRLVWRGSGNNNYFTQPLTGLKPNKGYQITLQQVANGNANANFNIGIGTAAGEYAVVSTTVKLGTYQDGVKTLNITTPATVSEDETYYFTFRNTSSNTANDGNDPVTQIDWIAMVAANDFPVTGASSGTFLYGTAYAPTTAKDAYLTVLQDAKDNRDNSEYTNVAGAEKAELLAAIAEEVADNKDAYNAATLRLTAAIDAFVVAKDSYDAYATALAAVGPITEANILGTPISGNTSATAENATTAAAILSNYNTVKTASASAPVQTTFVTNGTFDSNVTGWTSTGGFYSNKTANNQAGAFTGNFYENWNGSAKADKMYQTIENIPNGTYRLNIAAFVETLASPNESQYVFANSDKAYLTVGEPTGYEIYTVVTDNTLSIGLEQTTATSKWLGIDNVSVRYYGTGDQRTAAATAQTTALTALNTAITDAEKHTLGFEDGEYAPYTNVAALTLLNTTKAFRDNAVKDVTTINSATDALNAATWNANDGEVNAVSSALFTGTAYDAAGWTRTQSWSNTGDNGVYSVSAGTMTYGEVQNFEMPLKGNTAYKLSFKHRKWDGSNADNGGKVSVLNGSGEGLALTAYSGNSSTSLQQEDFVFVTGAAGNYVFSIVCESGRLTFNDVTILKATALTISDTDVAANVLKGFTNPLNITVNRTLVADKWQGFSLPFNLTADELSAALPDAQIVKFKSADENVIDFETATTVEAGEPYLIKPAAGENISTLTFTGKTIAADIDNVERGTGDYKFKAQLFADQLPTDGTVAYMSTATQKLKKLTSGNINGTRAYFVIPANVDPAAARITINGWETTGISDLKQKAESRKQMFDLQGRRVEKAQRGLYIVNGKKVVMK